MNRPIVCADIWDSPDIGLSEAQKAMAHRLRTWMRAYKSPFVRALADLRTESSPLTCDVKVMYGLQKDIESQFDSGKAVYTALVILSKFVVYVNRIGKGPIPQPRISHLVTKPPNPFRNGIAQDMACVQRWLVMEQKWIRECAVTPPVELVILSSILHGGILHASSVVNLTRALLAHRTPALGCIGSRVYVDMVGNHSLPEHNGLELEDRRWYPDDQTSALFRRPEKYAQVNDWVHLDVLRNDQVARRVFQKIRHRMFRDCLPKDLRPASLKQLIDAVATTARTEMPAVLVEYASRRIVSHSLRLDVLQHIYDVALTTNTPSSFEEPCHGAFPMDDVVSFEDRLPEDMEPAWLQQLRQAFRTKDRREASTNLEVLLSAFPNPSCPGHRITDFARYLLNERHRDQQRFVSRKPLAISTANYWTLTVARRFGRILGEQDPTSLTAENIETLYIHVLENVVEGDDPRQLRRKVVHALREFQEFLVGKLGAASIQDRVILGSPRKLLPVDAKIITLEQFLAARRYLRQPLHRERDAKLRHAAEVMLILGFRCGTRRMEAHGLELSDLIDHTSPWLLVRPTETRQLKTDNSKRQLPLSSLMPEDELDVLYSWKQARIQESVDGGSGHCSHLFAAPIQNENGVVETQPLSVQKLIAILHDALRQVTGDSTLHFHHLRHSFATWTFLRLMLSDLPEIPDMFPHLPETTVWIQEAKTFRHRLYGTAHPTRRHAMSVASLLGHSGPSVSMEHYIHCMDWLLPLFLAQSSLLQVSSTSRVARAAARHKSTLYEWERKLGRRSIPSQLFAHHFPERVATPNINHGNALSSWFPETGSKNWVSPTWDLLFLASTTNEPFDDLAEQLGFDIQTAENIFEHARSIQNIREHTGRQSPRHCMEAIAFDRCNPRVKTEIPCPKRCMSKEFQKAFDTMQEKLLIMAQNDVGTIQRILGYYVTRIWQTSNLLPFHNPDCPEDALLYRTFLNNLDIKNHQIWFVFFDQRERSISRRKWKEALNLTWRNRQRIKMTIPPYKVSSASNRWLGIEPDFSSNESAKSSRGSAEFRFLMVMAAIRFGYTQET